MRKFCVVMCSVMVLGVLGCNGESGPRYIPVTGKVTLDGEPLTGGTVYFFPENEGQSSYGGITKDGTYELYCVDQAGAVMGQHRVSVEGPQPVSEPNAKQPENPVPERYTKPETSEIIKEVKDVEKNVIDIELTSK
jgi:hypothetical protein